MKQKEFHGQQQVGKIYHSILDKKALCDFFLESVSSFLNASQSLLFLIGKDGRVWLAAGKNPPKQISKTVRQNVKSVFRKGKAVTKNRTVFVPLISSNVQLGVACFIPKPKTVRFRKNDVDLASDLSAQAAGALKKLLLHEENLKMARLATIGQMSSMVLHELKNILQIAQISNNYLEMGLRKQDEKLMRRAQQVVQKFIKNADGFIYDMLSLTKDYKFEPQKINLKAMLAELEKDVRPLAESWNVRIDFQVDEAIGEVEGENRSIYRSLLNLVKNAIEACDRKGCFVRVRINLTNKDRYQIVVEDNGKGMDDETKAGLFQAFFSTKGEKGTGLGLLIIEKTLKAHAGEIEFESELGKGTKFTLTLPKTLPGQ